MRTKERERVCAILTEAITTLPDKLGSGRFYDPATGLFCAVGWLNHCARRTRESGSPFPFANLQQQGFNRDDLNAVETLNDGTFASNRVEVVKARLVALKLKACGKEKS